MFFRTASACPELAEGSRSLMIHGQRTAGVSPAHDLFWTTGNSRDQGGS
jgi:hypothetical protein